MPPLSHAATIIRLAPVWLPHAPAPTPGGRPSASLSLMVVVVSLFVIFAGGVSRRRFGRRRGHPAEDPQAV